MRNGSTTWVWILAVGIISCKGEHSRKGEGSPARAAPPPKAEVWLARRPSPPGDESSGATLYAEHCSACHGEGRRGDGRGRAKLSASPRDLRAPLFLAFRSDNALVRTILQGGPAVGRSKDMPRFADELSEQDALDLITFLRHDALFMEECFPAATHYYLREGSDDSPDALLVAYASTVPRDGRPLLVTRAEQLSPDAVMLGYVLLLTELELPGEGTVPAALLADAQGAASGVRVGLPPQQARRAEAGLLARLPDPVARLKARIAAAR